MTFSTSQMATASMYSQVGGAATSAVGGYYAARSQKSALKHQASMAQINARIAELGAESAMEQGKQQVAALTMQAGQLKGKQRAALAANGVDLGQGSAAELQASTEIMKQIDMATARGNALRTAWGHRMQATNMRGEAAMAKASAGTINPFATGATSLLGGASSVASSWYWMNQAGAFSKQDDIAVANQTDDPIYSLGTSRGWW